MFPGAMGSRIPLNRRSEEIMRVPPSLSRRGRQLRGCIPLTPELTSFLLFLREFLADLMRVIEVRRMHALRISN